MLKKVGVRKSKGSTPGGGVVTLGVVTLRGVTPEGVTLVSKCDGTGSV